LRKLYSIKTTLNKENNAQKLTCRLEIGGPELTLKPLVGEERDEDHQRAGQGHDVPEYGANRNNDCTHLELELKQDGFFDYCSQCQKKV
jgi:hypothetical protein